MIDFSICIPTRFVFGKGKVADVGEEVLRFGGKRVLIVEDGGAYLTSLLKTVRHSLDASGLVSMQMTEKATIPCLSLVLKGVEFCKKNQIDFIIAVGGGTVMDTAKAIAFMSENDGDFTDYVSYKKESRKCMPVGSIVTMNGTGSEISATAMIIDDRCPNPIKLPLFQDSIRFKFSIIDPSLTSSLPLVNTISGAFDSITHIMEHYFCGASAYDLQDRMCESVICSLMNNMRLVSKNPGDLLVRSQLQIGATLANSTLLGLGCDSDWAMHYMENPITTLTHSLHGRMLAVIAPAWMRFCYKRDLPKAVNFATRVMGVPRKEDDEATAMAGIEAFERFISDVGLPTTLRQMGVVPEQFGKLAHLAIETAGTQMVGGVSHLSEDEIISIYKIAQ